MTLNKIRILLLIFFFSSILAVNFCGGDGGDAAPATSPPTTNTFTVENQIFQNTSPIQQISIIPEGSSEPSFAWQSIGQDVVVVAIFTEEIDIYLNSIANQDKIIWMWTTLMVDGREGNISYYDGGKFGDENIEPTPLSPGTYYWAIWALDENFIPSHSSKQYTLVVN